MIDSDFHCWLIEANTNPCIEESSKLLETLLPRLIDDMMKLTIDKVFTPQYQ
jgi:tubulin--tyrosine ligase